MIFYQDFFSRVCASFSQEYFRFDSCSLLTFCKKIHLWYILFSNVRIHAYITSLISLTKRIHIFTTTARVCLCLSFYRRSCSLQLLLLHLCVHHQKHFIFAMALRWNINQKGIFFLEATLNHFVADFRNTLAIQRHTLFHRINSFSANWIVNFLEFSHWFIYASQ